MLKNSSFYRNLNININLNKNATIKKYYIVLHFLPKKKINIPEHAIKLVIKHEEYYDVIKFHY